MMFIATTYMYLMYYSQEKVESLVLREQKVEREHVHQLRSQCLVLLDR